MKRNRRRPVIEALEARLGRPFAELAAEQSAAGRTISEAAKALQLNPCTFADACRALCPEVQWPTRGEAVSRARRRNRSAILVWYDNQWMTLHQAAKCAGICYSTLWLRYRTGRELFAPVHPGKGSGLPCYELGYSVRELEHVTRYARERGLSSAHYKFGIPKGAISALLRGQWERVA